MTRRWVVTVDGGPEELVDAESALGAAQVVAVAGDAESIGIVVAEPVPASPEHPESRWTHPICEACWIDRYGTWRPEPDLPLGTTEVLESIRRPTRMRQPRLEWCCFCGKPTIFGVYARADPDGLRCSRR